MTHIWEDLAHKMEGQPQKNRSDGFSVYVYNLYNYICRYFFLRPYGSVHFLQKVEHFNRLCDVHVPHININYKSLKKNCWKKNMFNPLPDAPCMEYLPTFGLWQM